MTMSQSTSLPSVETLSNSFNASECVSYLHKGWQDVVARMHDSEIPSTEKPEIYKAATQTAGAWTGAGGAWGSKVTLTAGGTDFLMAIWGNQNGKGR